jgi:hypothetical protein
MASTPRGATRKLEPEEFFDGHPLRLSALHRLQALLRTFDDVEVSATRSQVVLSIALGRHVTSSRFKHATPRGLLRDL